MFKHVLLEDCTDACMEGAKAKHDGERDVKYSAIN